MLDERCHRTGKEPGRESHVLQMVVQKRDLVVRGERWEVFGVRWLSAIQGNKGKQNKAGKERVISVPPRQRKPE